MSDTLAQTLVATMTSATLPPKFLMLLTLVRDNEAPEGCKKCILLPQFAASERELKLLSLIRDTYLQHHYVMTRDNAIEVLEAGCWADAHAFVEYMHELDEEDDEIIPGTTNTEPRRFLSGLLTYGEVKAIDQRMRGDNKDVFVRVEIRPVSPIDSDSDDDFYFENELESDAEIEEESGDETEDKDSLPQYRLLSPSTHKHNVAVEAAETEVDGSFSYKAEAGALLETVFATPSIQVQAVLRKIFLGSLDSHFMSTGETPSCGFRAMMHEF